MKKVCSGVYLVCGGDLPGAGDAMGYLVQGETLALIDAGAEPSSGHRILDRIAQAERDPQEIEYLLVTHGHVDHIGGIKPIVEKTGSKVVCHEGDADAIRTGDPVRTAASWYGISLPQVDIDVVLQGKGGQIAGLNWIHTPGHTPGSLAFTFESEDGLVLFGQDIHGPFSHDFESNISLWAQSMKELIALEADILCEGHFGVYRGKQKVRDFIEQHLQAYGYFQY